MPSYAKRCAARRRLKKRKNWDQFPKELGEKDEDGNSEYEYWLLSKGFGAGGRSNITKQSNISLNIAIEHHKQTNTIICEALVVHSRVIM